MKNTDKNIVQKLRAAGVRATKQRIAVMECLSENSKHYSAEEIYDKLKEEIPSLSLGSVYHILDIFCEEGLAKRLSVEKGPKRFDVADTPHHHLVCNDSNEVFDYFDEELTGLIKKYLREKPILGFDVTDIELQIRGKRKV
ncbi:Fur family transcriptional regulator [Mangrovivirga sp. M17]|uniref:Fur family transcriptional regulator n=1 Tax=Mangrovivirga halotolerans TaxID=2993936 RepID=A0ABT3RM05_9BACT|nr:Fur family transcriptional regulator [Mangrovivirga halotolerans]MCX2742850.1 Fur family transcriptional regulator [Mangrovivirga halotolerans]